MNRSEAEALATEALEVANDGQWGELLAMDLPDTVVELIRQKAQLNTRITNLEEQERILWELIIQLLEQQQ